MNPPSLGEIMGREFPRGAEDMPRRINQIERQERKMGKDEGNQSKLDMNNKGRSDGQRRYKETG